MTNGAGFNGAMPLWMKFVSAVGVPSAIAIYLVWLLASQVLGAIQVHADRSETNLRELLPVLRQICINTSATDSDRAACFRSE